MDCQIRRADQVLVSTDTLGKGLDLAIGLCLRDKDGRGVTIYCDGVPIQRCFRIDNQIHIQACAPLQVCSLPDMLLKVMAK